MSKTPEQWASEIAQLADEGFAEASCEVIIRRLILEVKANTLEEAAKEIEINVGRNRNQQVSSLNRQSKTIRQQLKEI